MSTPRLGHANYCLYTPGGNSTCICGEIKYPSSVAAPLEPSALDLAHRIWAIGYIGPVPKPTAADEAEIKLIAKMVSEWAAAVSKNLQEERDKLKAELDMVDEALARRPALAHIDHRYNKIFAACAGAAKSDRLEKEIAALRETK